MNRKFKRASCFLFVILSMVNTAFANTSDGVGISIRIESHDRLFLSENAYAYTFLDALKAVSTRRNMDVQTDSSGGKIRLHSINGITNGHFGGADAWFSYIERDGEIIKDHAMDMALKQNDKLIIYYGDGNTNILSEFRLDVEGNRGIFFAGVQNANWVQVDGKWQIDGQTTPVADVRIDVGQPNPSGNYKVYKTGSDGYARVSFDQTGVYTYRYKKYNTGGVPSIVAGEKSYYLHGIANPAGISRGEAAAFLVNTFGISGKASEATFDDVNYGNANYNEIMTAYQAGIVSGKSESLFAPDERVSLAAFCVMLCNATGTDPKKIVSYKDVPDWALYGVNGAIQTGLLNNIETNWNGNITGSMLIEIYKNQAAR